MCPTGTGVSTREKGYISDDLMKKIFENIKDHKLGIRFIRWGEPTLHPKIIEYIEMVKSDGHLCHINTNGKLLNNDMTLKLLNSGLDSIKFSFQGIDEKSYNEMRQSGNFNQLISSIKLMYKLRGNNSLPYIHIATTTTYENNDEIDIFKKGVKEFCDLVTVGKTKMEHIDVDKTKINEEQKKVLIELKKKESLIKKRLILCPEVFGKLSIDWNGKVTACCSDYNAEMVVGDINQNSILEIFNGEKINFFRSILKDQKYEKINKCSKCYDLMNIQTK